MWTAIEVQVSQWKCCYGVACSHLAPNTINDELGEQTSSGRKLCHVALCRPNEYVDVILVESFVNPTRSPDEPDMLENLIISLCCKIDRRSIFEDTLIGVLYGI